MEEPYKMKLLGLMLRPLVTLVASITRTLNSNVRTQIVTLHIFLLTLTRLLQLHSIKPITKQSFRRLLTGGRLSFASGLWRIGNRL